jgi:hypothetical protein
LLSFAGSPTLKRGANKHCAYGAGVPALRNIERKNRGSAMNAKPNVVFWMICTVFAAGIAIAQTKDKKPAAEPRAFYEECGGGRPCSFDNPVSIPNNVLDALRATEEARSMHDALARLNREEFAGLFKAIKIHLVSPSELDYVVMGEFPMGGADAPWFWIVRFDKASPKVIFFTFANSFELLNSGHSGYPDIRSLAYVGGVTYTEIYQYNGQHYVLMHRYHKETPP